MSYIKQTWVNLPDKTTPISADRLNHIEDGIEAIDQDLENIDEHLTDYVKNTDYADDNNAGVIKTSPTYGTSVVSADGRIFADIITYSNYNNYSQYGFISKGTLDNVLTATIGDIGEVLDELQREEI